MNTDSPITRIRTPEFIASYTHIFKPQRTDDGNDRWSLRMIFPEGTDLNPMYSAAFNAGIEQWGEEEARRLIENKLVKWPFRDSSSLKKPDPHCEGKIFINASTTTGQPEVVEVVDGNLVPLRTVSEFYAGCTCIATVNFYHFDRKGNEGIAAGLENILKIKDGPRIGGGAPAESDFADYVASKSSGAPNILG